jgi:large subunit ribosomal protein L6
MSRIGKQPVPIVGGAKVAVSGNTVNVEGPLGKLSWQHRPEVKVSVDENKVLPRRY